MRYLVFADIHANLAALEAVLAAAGQVDGYIFLGDVVSYGPDPLACVRLLESLEPLAIAGNHDLVIRQLARQLPDICQTWDEWTAKQLDERALAYLEQLPERLELELNGQTALLVHDSRQLADQASLVLSGHSHAQIKESKAGCLFINPGSVSQQRDGSPLARYAIWDQQGFSFERTAYPVEKTIVELGRVGLNPFSQAEWIKNYRYGSYNPKAGQGLADK